MKQCMYEYSVCWYGVHLHLHVVCLWNCAIVPQDAIGAAWLGWL